MRKRMRWLAVALVACMLVLVLPTPARADDDFSLTRTVIQAVVDESGGFDVLEERAVQLDGSFHGFYWELPTKATKISTPTLKVLEAGEVSEDGSTLTTYAFSPNSSDTTPGVWTMQEGSDSTRVDVHFDKSDETAYFYVRYHVDGGIVRWQDVSELNWKAIGDQWTKDSGDVSVVVSFAGAPEGSSVTAGDNLRGWLHNASLVGNISIPSGTIPSDPADGDPGTVTATIPYVQAGDFAELHVTFPTDWTPQLQARNENRLDAVLAEEGALAEQQNQQLQSMGFFGTLKKWLYTIVAAFDLVALVISFISYKQSHKVTFKDKYFRDVPTDDHPAVLSYLYTGEAGNGPDFTASLMRLTDMKVINIEKVTYLKERILRKPKEQEDWLLTPNPQAAAQITDPIDRATYDFVFDFVASYAARIVDSNPRPDGSVYMADFKTVANNHKSYYQAELETWSDVVTDEVFRKGYDASEEGSFAKLLLVAMGVSFFTLGLGVIDTFIFSSNSLQLTGDFMGVLLRLAILLVAFILVVMANNKLHERSAEGDEVKAQLEALRNWLQDFTKLDEAIPTDVVLWNRLLVMAVVLGVADKVIKQLELALPQVYQDEYMYNSVLWCSPSMRGDSAASSFTSGFSESVSAASASGSGGGATSGGGDGFGGGGGGAY